jgi:outer membrane immunogenic protein
MKKRLLFILLISTNYIATAGTIETNTVINPLWENFYLGGNIGLVWGHTKNTLNTIGNAVNPYFYLSEIPSVNGSGSLSLDTTKLTGGAQIGYNLINKNGFLLGLELSYDYINLYKITGGTFHYSTTNASYYLTTAASAKQLGTLRPRIGYAFNKLLPFVTGGGAVTKLNFNQVFSEPPYSSVTTQFNKIKYGWVLGAGVEYACLNNISLKIEYLFTSFGNTNSSSALVGTGLATGFGAVLNNTTSNLRVQTLLFGVNYHFA